MRDITFGVFHSPPFMFYNSENNICGPLIDLSKKIAAFYGCIPRFENLTQEALNSFNDSTIDIGLGIFKTNSRKNLGDFSIPIAEIGLQGLGIVNNYFFSSIAGVTDCNYKIGVKEGDVGHSYLKEHFSKEWISKNVIIIEANSQKDSYSLLIEAKCELILCDMLTLENQKQLIPIETMFFFQRPILIVELCYLINKSSIISKEELNLWFQKYSTIVDFDLFYNYIKIHYSSINLLKWFEIRK